MPTTLSIHGAAIAAGAEFDGVIPGFGLGIFAEEFVAGLIVGEEAGGENVAAVDGAFVVDLPAPAGVHGLGDGVGVDEIIGAIPTADNGTVAEKGIGVGDEGLLIELPYKLGAEARGVDEEIGAEAAAVFEHDGFDAGFSALAPVIFPSMNSMPISLATISSAATNWGL